MRRLADCGFAVAVGCGSTHWREQTGATAGEFGAGHDCPSLVAVRVIGDLGKIARARFLRLVALAADDQVR